MMVADATQLNKIELLLKMIPFGPPSKHKNRGDTQATHQNKTSIHHFIETTCSSVQLIGILKSGL